MEHRWGERVELRLTVELHWGSSPPLAGSIVNVSASGAFVRRQGHGPPRGPVEVTFPEHGAEGARPVRLPAYVVRETPVGVGIEWREFAPRSVRELLLRDRRAGRAVRTRARAYRPAGQLPIQRSAVELATPGACPSVLAAAAR